MSEKITLLVVLIVLAVFIVGLIVFVLVNLFSTHGEENIIVLKHSMNSYLQFEHDTIFEHKNCETGQSYVFWLYINNWDYKYGKLKPVMNKGSALDTKKSYQDTLLYSPSAPGIFLAEKELALQFIFKETETKDSSTSGPHSNGANTPYELTDIPLKKWFHVGMTIQSNMVEIYLDGSLVDTVYMDSEIAINYSPLHIAENDGFDGFLSKLAVFPKVLTDREILQKYLAGPPDIDMEAQACGAEVEYGDEGSELPDTTNTDSWSLAADPQTTTVAAGNGAGTETGNGTVNISANGETAENVSLTLDVATFYARPNFEDENSISLPVGLYTMSHLQSIGVTPKTISGVKINPGYLVTLYENVEPTSTEGKIDHVFLRNNTDWNGALKNMNNKAQSFKIEKDPYVDILKASFYQRPEYKGWGVTLPIGKYTSDDLKAHGIELNEITSYQIEPGYQVRLFDNDYFTDNYTVITEDSEKMDGFDNKTVSLIIEQSQETTFGPTFYELIEYKGRKVSLPLGSYDYYELLRLGFLSSFGSLKLGSIFVPDEYHILLYPNDKQGGIPQKITTDTPKLSDALFHWSIVKSIKVIDSSTPKYSVFDSCSIL
jgi:hypothetical protein